MSEMIDRIKRTDWPDELLDLVCNIIHYIETLEAQNAALAGIRSTDRSAGSVGAHETTEGGT